MNAHAPRRGSLTAVSAAVLLLVAAAPVSAHVSVNPKTAEPGSYARLTFRVPNERPDSATVRLEVALPPDQPLRSVSVKPVPGWRATAEKSELATPLKSGNGDVTTVVSKITWVGGKIQPGEFQEFDVSVGPLPETAGRIVFKAIQTYDNGEVVRWIDVAEEGSAEKPEHPAPVLELTAAGQQTTPETPQLAVAAEVDQSVAAAATAPRDKSARILGGLALVTGLLGILLTLLARRATRRDRP